MPDDLTDRLEADWARWLLVLFRAYISRAFAPHHEDFWKWVWAIRVNERPKPYVAIWSRGHTKSTSAELGTVALAARKRRNYGVYVCSTQDQADDHVGNVAGMLESQSIERWYPDLADRQVGKYGHARGWRRNRLRTRSGFVLDALGLDTASRGMKIDEDRPDLFVFDDIDNELDSPAAIAKKRKMITQRILPAGTPWAAVLAIQNLIRPDGIFGQLAGTSTEPADYLADRIVSGPIPAIENLETEFTEDEAHPNGHYVITAGEPTWSGMELGECQAELDTYGLTAFLTENQHAPPKQGGGMFDHLIYRRCKFAELPPLDLVVVWVDPAVTSKEDSDAMGVQCDGLARDGTIYRLFSWEQRATPLTAIKKGLEVAQRYGAVRVGIETDQGGETWESVYREAQVATGIRIPMASDKAGAGYGPKVHRVSQMLPDYETGRIVHVEGTHEVLESALNRFPKFKPYDLVDACLAEGTPVLTDQGWVPIEHITAGDIVRTRGGWRRVRDAGCTGFKPVGYMPAWGLTATADHPVWTEKRGWVLFGDVRRSDMIATCRDGLNLNTEVVGTGATRMPRSEITGCTTRACRPSGPGFTVSDDAAAFALNRVLPVFNLEVEHEPEFFAAGVLVHNCFWGWKDLRSHGPVKVSTPAGLVLPRGLLNRRGL